MTVELTREFRFESAHHLPQVPADHKCHRMHGHSYRVVVTLQGPVDPTAGWLVDFGEIDRRFAPLCEQLDHRVLNDLPGLENPTAEHLAIWIWDRLAPDLPALHAVTIWETPRASCTYRGA